MRHTSMEKHARDGSSLERFLSRRWHCGAYRAVACRKESTASSQMRKAPWKAHHSSSVIMSKLATRTTTPHNTTGQATPRPCRLAPRAFIALTSRRAHGLRSVLRHATQSTQRRFGSHGGSGWHCSLCVVFLLAGDRTTLRVVHARPTGRRAQRSAV